MSEGLSKTVNPQEIEDKWYSHWQQKGYFYSEPDERPAYTVVIPPPNVTGVLHMGHMLNNTIQDVLVRRARMLGYNACWVPGTDHASIATEAKVVNKLREEGIKKGDISRDEFLQHAWDWTEKHGGIILEQLKKLGASCDWQRTRFTLDSNYYKSVISVFIDLYEKGYIYRGKRMIHWDPQALTALSDEEVNHKEVNTRFYYVRYKIESSEDEWITIATTRPETILGDVAIAVHPTDQRYKHLHGKKVIVPIVNRIVPVICDTYVDIELGTGALKITPAHDVNDYEIGKRHKLPTLDILNANGTIAESAGFYVSMDRFEARKRIAEDLDELGYLVKIEDRINKVGYSERTDVPIEPRISLQWFCKMEELAKPALEHVMDDTIQFHPPKFKNTYRHWMENIRDWCISRQLWWGHRIPAYYYGEGPDDYVVSENEQDALEKARVKSGNSQLKSEELKQDQDVLDTWFSSWIWPMAVFDGVQGNNKDVDYYYPTNDLVTAPEIMFFWVARMIISGYEYKKKPPFTNVYYTGIVRDKLGRKMSKSLGNSPDPLHLIEKFGADGVRVGMLLSSPAGNDLLFDSALCEQGRNFSNKIWNALRLVHGWEEHRGMEQPEYAVIAVDWFRHKLNAAITELNDLYSKFRLNEALMVTYKLFWDDFCSWYLEMIKPGFEQPIDSETLKSTKKYFESLLKLLHPFMPFITEEAWHTLSEKEEDLMVSKWPVSDLKGDNTILQKIEPVLQLVSEIRRLRNDKGISPKVVLNLALPESENLALKSFAPVAVKLANLGSVEYGIEKPDGAFVIVLGTHQYFLHGSVQVDTKSELKKLDEEIIYTRGFLDSVLKKLQNEKFVNGAPSAVVDAERKKAADAQSKLALLQQKLAALK
jgi:valyl-tRNA synthetase